MKLHLFLSLCVACILLMLVAAACGSTAKSTAKVQHRRPHTSEARGPSKPQPPKKVAIDPSLPEATKALIAEANSWLGVPYKWAGNDRDGVDCSGFVLQVFLRALDIKLPRTSATQNEYCRRLDRSKLRPGDLVFFDTKRDRDGQTSHVGLYVGDGNMIHSSSSGGVIVTPIDGPFFGDRLLNGGRVEALARAEKRSSVKPAPQSRDMPSQSRDVPSQSRDVPSACSPEPGVKNEEPAPKPQPKPAPEPVSKPGATTAPKPTPQPAPSPAITNLAPEQARALVLDMLVEEKIDSIYSK